MDLSVLQAIGGGLASAVVITLGKVWLDRRRARREEQARAEKKHRRERLDTGKIILQTIEGSTADRDQAVEILREMLTHWKAEAKRWRQEAEQWERKSEEWARHAEQCRKEQASLRQALVDEQRRTAQLEAKVDRMCRDLEQERTHREQLQRMRLDEYARNSTPAPPPDEGTHQ